MRRALLAAVLLLCAAPTAVAGEPQAPLLATTTIEGSVGGYVGIRLDRDVRLDFADGDLAPAATTTGLRPAEFLLLGQGGAAEDAPGLRGSYLEGPHLWISTLSDPAEPWTAASRPYTLPAGDYRLYLLPDGESSPGSVTLRLPATVGEQRLEPLFATTMHTKSLARRDGLEPQENLVVFGDEVDLPSDGYLSVLLAGVSFPSALQRLEICRYADAAHDGRSDAFSFGCPGGESYEATATPNGTRLPVGLFAWVTDWDAAAGRWGVGGNLQLIGAPGAVEGRATWMSWDGIPIPGATLPSTPAATGPPASRPPKPKAKRRNSRCRRAERKHSRRAGARRCRKARSRRG